MDTNNYVLTALPGYVKYSRREIGKASKEDRRETAFSGIRQKLSSAVISVPYGGGLDNLRLIGSLEDHEFQNRYTSYSKPTRKKHRSRNASESEAFMSEGEMSPIKTHHRHYDQFSPAKIHYSGKKPQRIGSETSTTSTATTKSKSTSYSTSETDDAFWAEKLKNLDEIKERYSDNSEFLTHLYEHIHKHEKHRSSKKKKKKKGKHKDENMNKHKEEHLESQNEHAHHHNNSTSTDTITGRLVLPPIQKSQFHAGKSTRESTLTNASDESNTSTIVAQDESENLKKRKVEFNLHKKRIVRLPALESKQGRHESTERREHHKSKHPKRSILKKIDKNSDVTVNSFPKNGKPSPSEWNLNAAKLISPIPNSSSASRRHQVTFKRNPFNFTYKCSKEFEAVATHYEDDRKPSFLTE